ncbi:hypothetical protein F7725_022564, partial [Dissostichus mawsoni]
TNHHGRPSEGSEGGVDVASAAAPDGGYARFILLSSFLAFGLTFGVIKAFAPVANALSARYSRRSVVIAGGLISSVGVVFGAFRAT